MATTAFHDKRADLRCDIFCNVIDNFGDIGVCWRLARQLRNEYGVQARLWVDDLKSFSLLCHEVEARLEFQRCQDIEVCHWTDASFPTPFSVSPANLVIEAFSCKLPENYLLSMVRQEPKPVWISLEYLSAENWVETHHKLPSPHPRFPLVKYFFFPGFTGKTGGLLLENGLLAKRGAFDREAFWRTVGEPLTGQDEIRISLFCYENPMLSELLTIWAKGIHKVNCLLPEGRTSAQVAAYLGVPGVRPGDVFERGNLRMHIQPFVEQEQYDHLLWACDVNFVRGEDSFVRAQWAANPFVWHIYPQQDGVHIAKLRAFMEKYCAGLPEDASRALQGLWENWNGEPGSLRDAWNDFLTCRSMLRQHSVLWAGRLAENNLALNLLDFFREIGKMRAFGIEGQ